MIRANHHFLINPFFRRYSIRKIRRHFHEVTIEGSVQDRGLPILLLSNHVSWWDGFWATWLNEKRFHRKLFFMMKEEMLRKHSYFQKAGGYSVKKGSRSIVETLNYTAELLADSRNLVLVFPQGRIESAYTPSFRFAKGIESILRKTKNEVQIIFLANLVDYFSNPKPGLYMYMREYSDVTQDILALESEYNAFYAECVGRQLGRAGS